MEKLRNLQIYPPYASRYEIEGHIPCKTAGATAKRKMKQ